MIGPYNLSQDLFYSLNFELFFSNPQKKKKVNMPS